MSDFDSKNLFLTTAVALGIAALTAVIGWDFAHLVELSTSMADVKSKQETLLKHSDKQDQWIDELNKKIDTDQTEVRTSIGHVNDLLYDINSRLRDGPGRKP